MQRFPRHRWYSLVLAASLPLSGCSSFLTEGSADLAGISGAAIAGSITSSAAGAAAIGLGVRSIAGEGVRFAERRVHRSEQDAIAQVAGPLEPGTVQTWSVRHVVPIEDNQAGQVVVSRAFGTGTFRCKEIVFSVDTTTRQGPQRAFYTASICQDGATWRWASAEPSTDRWGGLQ